MKRATDKVPVRIIIAVGLDGFGLVLNTDSRWVAHLAKECCYTDDMGISHTSRPGLYLWAGTINFYDGPPHYAFRGKTTRIQYGRLLDL